MIGTSLLLIGWVVALAGGLACLVAIFRNSVGWGIASLLFAPIGLIPVFLFWKDTKKPFIVELAGWAVAGAGWLLGGTFPSPS